MAEVLLVLTRLLHVPRRPGAPIERTYYLWPPQTLLESILGAPATCSRFARCTSRRLDVRLGHEVALTFGNRLDRSRARMGPVAWAWQRSVGESSPSILRRTSRRSRVVLIDQGNLAGEWSSADSNRSASHMSSSS